MQNVLVSIAEKMLGVLWMLLVFDHSAVLSDKPDLQHPRRTALSMYGPCKVKGLKITICHNHSIEFIAYLSQRQRCLYDRYVVTKSYMLQALSEGDFYHTPCKSAWLTIVPPTHLQN